jgi:hypothetical protein
MKVCQHESSRMLNGKQEGNLNESLCAQARQSLRISPDFYFILFYQISPLPAHQSELET